MKNLNLFLKLKTTFKSFSIILFLVSFCTINNNAQDFVSSGNLGLGGANTYDNFTLSVGDILTVTPGAPLIITATATITINGTIDGNEAGNVGGLGANGAGAGGGSFSNNSGAGGGSYGGVGGTGGFDSGDIPGVGGPTYGTNNGTDFDMGSGAGGNIVVGGNGGGAIQLLAPTIIINGSILANGGDGLSAGQCSGGGSGGCIYIDGINVTLSGILSVEGGGGGIGLAASNDSGGGGGGGRIKIFATNLVNTATISEAGGLGGPNGSSSGSQPGAIGTIFIGASLNIVSTIANDDANGDGIPDIADPCDCTDPLNPDPLVVMGPNGGEVFHELVTVTSGAGETWEMDATTVGALDATGLALAFPAFMTEVSSGVYTISFYHEITDGYTGDFSNGTTTLNIANSCTVTCIALTVPTLGEWGLIVFSLLLLNMAILFVVRRRKKSKMALS